MVKGVLFSTVTFHKTYINVHKKCQLHVSPGTGQKVCGGWWWLNVILVFYIDIFLIAGTSHYAIFICSKCLTPCSFFL
jgi:hypothetical protein